MSLVTLLPFIVLIGAMFLMTRSAKRKQQQATQMRDQMQPGSGVRTIGGMYAIVKEVQDETVLLEVAPGTHAIYAKNAIGAVLDDEEYNRIVHGTGDALDLDDAPIVPDDASSLSDISGPTETDAADETADTSDDSRIDLGKRDKSDDAADDEDTTDAKDAADGDDGSEAKVAAKAATAEADDAAKADAKPKKTDGESDAK